VRYASTKTANGRGPGLNLRPTKKDDICHGALLGVGLLHISATIARVDGTFWRKEKDRPGATADD